MGYPHVKIHDSTNFNVKGKVRYMSVFCSDDDFSATPSTTWQASSRGVCLLTEITATVITPQGNIEATPYKSSGTSYSEFAVISRGGNNFAVTRVVTATDESLPEDYVEPTTQQK
ncbi:hypothetical protein [Alkalimonas amylolytica]|uniref:Uncharacterized protein n=1 Tax=Alkalimonas amylolytica TaxID=152573 RepID=A0A1H3ZRX2_ALKAM|nr:hypothetical protein [Alkalimonas amylolytica]SEA26355.1 hypothetical protein SAMN04488051_102325 [Alkalimonas amylolytica]